MAPVSRRHLLAAGAAFSLAGCSAEVNKAMDLTSRMLEIKKRHGGRIGVSALQGTKSVNLDSGERFAMCSTFKWVLAAAILQQVDQGKLSLGKEIAYGQKDLLDYAPVTEAHVGDGKMAIGDLCAAAVELSDNTAANLLLPLVGGPAGLTQFVRGLGDATTRFDRTEPTLNTNVAGDDRDTTTPQAMALLLKTVFTGTVLKPASLDRLKAWMIATSTGQKRIRSVVPAGWTAGDKTGTGENGAVNDVAVIWPDKGDPIFMAIYTSGGTLDAAGREAIVADTAKLALDVLKI
jgi:beta-lactamase class A